MSLLRRRLTLGLLLLLAAAPARAGDPLGAAFRKLTKAQIKQAKAGAAEELKQFKAAIAPLVDGYASGTFTLETVVAVMLGSTSELRDELEDGALDLFSSLASAGQQLLVDAGSPAPGPDFQAGGRGAWDDALESAEASLDKLDLQVRVALAKLVKDLRKAAQAQGTEVDVRFSLPPHGSAFWSVVAPAGLPPDPLDGGLDAQPPQILLAVRYVDGSTEERIGVSLRGVLSPVQGFLATTDSDALLAINTPLGSNGVANSTTTVALLDHVLGVMTVQLDDGTRTSAVTAVSAPRLGKPSGDTGAILDTFSQDLKEAKKEVSKLSGAALKALGQALASHKKAVASGQASPELALRTGFSNLRDAREAIATAFGALEAVRLDTSAALQGGGFDDDDLPPDFHPDADGLYGKLAPKLRLLLAAREAAAGKAYDKFAGSILKTAAKQDLPVGANWIVGRVQPFELPFVLAGNVAPPPMPFAAPQLTDALTLVTQPAADEMFSALLLVQADPSDVPAVALSITTIPAGDVTDLGELAVRPGGTQNTEVPLLGDVPILGWLFKGGPSATDQGSLVVLMRPTLVTAAR